MPEISIVTVVFNDVIGIEKTIKSVLEQKFKDIQFIIIDGCSSDGTKDVINKYIKHIYYYSSEKDDGIYHAMNKGLSVATGKWVNFLNAGDVYVSPNTLASINLNDLTYSDVIYGDMIHEGKLSIALNVDYLSYGEIIGCHQAMFFSNKFLENFNIKYDQNYKIYSDYDFIARIYKLGGKFYYINNPVVVYEGGGISSKVSWLKRRDKYISVYKNFGFFKLILSFFYRISLIFRNF